MHIREVFPEVSTAKSEEAYKGDMPRSRYMSKIALLGEEGYKPGNVCHGEVFATYPRSAGLPEELLKWHMSTFRTTYPKSTSSS